MGRPLYAFLNGFNNGFENSSRRYGKLVAKVTRRTAVMLIIYALLIVTTFFLFRIVPTGFIPRQDQGYFIISVQLPPGASLDRTDQVVKKALRKILSIPGISNAVGFTGFAGATFTNSSNAAAIFPVLDSFEKRREQGLTYESLLGKLRQEMASIKEAMVVVIPPPPVRGIGNAGGFKMMIQDRGGRGTSVLAEAVANLALKANQTEATTSVFTFFENSTPRVHLALSREKAERLGVPVARVIEALEVFLGSAFINEFNYLGRTFRVIAQADAEYRHTPDDILRLKVRNTEGNMVPIGSIATIENDVGPSRLPRYNLYPAIDLIGDVKPGISTGEALATMERLAAEVLPDGIGYEWTELAYQQKMVGNTAIIAFILGVVFVFYFCLPNMKAGFCPLLSF